MWNDFIRDDQKVDTVLIDICFISLLLLSTVWSAVVFLLAAGVIGMRWNKNRKFSRKEGILLAVFLSMMVLMTVTTISRMAPTRYFKEMCENLFENPQQYRAINQEDIDVTEEFVERYRDDYEKGRQRSLRNVFYKELSSITWTEKTQRKEQGKIYTDYQIHVYFLGRWRAPEERWFEQTYRIKGFLVQDAKTEEILDYGTPRLYPEEFYGQGNLEGKVNGISVRAKPTENGKDLEVWSDFSIELKKGKLASVCTVDGPSQTTRV